MALTQVSVVGETAGGLNRTEKETLFGGVHIAQRKRGGNQTILSHRNGLGDLVFGASRIFEGHFNLMTAQGRQKTTGHRVSGRGLRTIFRSAQFDGISIQGSRNTILIHVGSTRAFTILEGNGDGISCSCHTLEGWGREAGTIKGRKIRTVNRLHAVFEKQLIAVGDSEVVTTATFHASSHDGISLTFLELDALGMVLKTFIVGTLVDIRTSIFGTKVTNAIPAGLVGNQFQVVEAVVGRKPQFTGIV